MNALQFKNKRFKATFKTASWDAGFQGRVRPQALLRYLEETAWRHAESGRIDNGTLQRQGLFWVLVRQSVRLSKEVGRGEDLDIFTWHSGHDRLYYYRNFEIQDKTGDTVASSATAWSVVDGNTRRVLRTSAVPVEIPEEIRKAVEEKPPEKIPLLKHPEAKQKIVAGFRDLDVNGHVNNIRYPEWFFESVPEETLFSSRLARLEVEYRSEVRFGECLTSEICRESPECFLHSLLDADGKCVCRARTWWMERE